MVSWLCPKCKNRMFSAHDSREKEYVQCIGCEFWFVNPYYRMSYDGLTQG